MISYVWFLINVESKLSPLCLFGKHCLFPKVEIFLLNIKQTYNISALAFFQQRLEENLHYTTVHQFLQVSIYKDKQADRQSPNHVMAGFAVPLTLAEAMNNFAGDHEASHATTASSDEFGSTQAGRDPSFPQIRSVHDTYGLVDDVRLHSSSTDTLQAERCSTVDSQEKLTTSSPCAYPFDYTRTAVATNRPDSSFEALNRGYEGLWDFNKFIIPPELVEKCIERAGVQPMQPSGSCLPGEWIMTGMVGFHSHSPASSRLSNELSLSLVTSQPSVVHGNSTQEQCSGTSFSGSRFLLSMQEILVELARYALENTQQMSRPAAGIEDAVSAPFPSSYIAARGYQAIDSADGVNADHSFMFHDDLFQEDEVEAKKKHLLALLQVVDDRYNQCLDEIHTVTSAFHAVTELDPNLHARFALPTISVMYKNLRERISSHILEMGSHLGKGRAREEKSFDVCLIQKQWALQQLSKRDPQIWRPHRGLPERSVSVLRAWMFQNFLHPYPKDAEKHLLALRSGLTRNQVSNWFINARVRLWKPMIEEMYAEMNRRKAGHNNQESEGSHRNQIHLDNTRFTMG